MQVAHFKVGINWTDIYEIESKTQGEFSYSANLQGSDELNTFDRKKMKHVILKTK